MVFVLSKLLVVGEPSSHVVLSNASLCCDGKSMWLVATQSAPEGASPPSRGRCYWEYVQPVARDNAVREREGLPHKGSRAVQVPAENEQPLCGPLKPCVSENRYSKSMPPMSGSLQVTGQQSKCCQIFHSPYPPPCKRILKYLCEVPQ